MSYDYKFKPIEKWPRALTSSRQWSRFDSTYKQTLELLDKELDKLSARNVVIQLALQPSDIRLDGLPRANARPAAHPGVILSFEKWVPNGKRNERGQRLGDYVPLSFPCDQFREWEDNLRAIALSLEALRKVDRYGVTQSGEQYKGWAALPSGDGDSEFTVDAAAHYISAQSKTQATSGDVMNNAESFKIAFRLAMRHLHPDNGGDTESFQLLQRCGDMLKAHHGLGGDAS